MTIAAVVAGFAIGYFVRRILAEAKIGSAEQAARKIVEEAEKEAEAARREILLEAKEEAHRLRTEIEQESRARRGELQRSERRLFQKEESLDRKAEALERREEAINRKERELDGLKKDLEHVYEQQRAELERLSGLSSDEARELLLKNIEEEIRHEAAIMIRDIEARTKEEADRKAREIIATAIQRYAADHVAEATVTVVALPNDEMKGRIIGRE
ncbi:MAG TPA: ribonuclease Y, partial [Firmicutes bacterium]|nr:ribonuclease Y [Bacillota bacterium]